MKHLIVLQTAIPAYRKPLFDFINQISSRKFKLYGGLSYFEDSIITDRSIKYRKHITNIFLFRRKFLFQYGFWHEVFNKAPIILELNPRILSNWVILFLRKILGYRTVLWGHAWPRKGILSTSDNVRNIMRSLGSAIIVYSESQREELQLKMPNINIIAAPNALYQKSLLWAENLGANQANILYVGRLTREKKIMLLVKSFALSLKEIPEHVNLQLVGEGEEKSNILNFVSSHKLNHRIKLLGHIDDVEKLRMLYSSSLFSVSPGYIGLSCIQSFGFGVPMIIANKENHSPEIEAAKENFNALYFESNNIDSLAKTIALGLSQRQYWASQRKKISAYCREFYTIELMGKRILDAINI